MNEKKVIFCGLLVPLIVFASEKDVHRAGLPPKISYVDFSTKDFSPFLSSLIGVSQLDFSHLDFSALDPELDRQLEPALDGLALNSCDVASITVKDHTEEQHPVGEKCEYKELTDLANASTVLGSEHQSNNLDAVAGNEQTELSAHIPLLDWLAQHKSDTIPLIQVAEQQCLLCNHKFHQKGFGRHLAMHRDDQKKSEERARLAENNKLRLASA